MSTFPDPSLPHGPGHRKVELPPIEEIAERVRNGETVAELARQYQRTRGALGQRLNNAGYRRDGTLPQHRPDPEQLLGPLRPWRVVPEFYDDARCNSTDPAIFFPEKGGDPGWRRAAKSICRGCEVRVQCLNYALANEEPHGIWGGLTPRERARLNRKAPR